jgi:hypothetical protein
MASTHLAHADDEQTATPEPAPAPLASAQEETADEIAQSIDQLLFAATVVRKRSDGTATDEELRILSEVLERVRPVSRPQTTP